MRINNNLMAMNTHRQLGVANNAHANSMGKLSSGLRINKAGDDAAGLSISEKMRGQIRGLNQASRNSQDGISMIQTAEGALNETHSILQRMRELSVQSSSDTNVDELDRESIQNEFSKLKEEIDRIGNTTEFNTQKLIDGSIGAKKAAGTDNAAVITEGLGKATAANAAATAVAFNAGSKKIEHLTTAIDSTTQKVTVDGAEIEFSVTKAGLEGTAGDTTGKQFATYLQEQVNKGIDEYNSKYGQKIDKVTVSAKDNKIAIKSGSTGKTSGVSVTAATSAVNNLWEIAGYTADATTKATGVDGKFTAAGAANFAAVKDGMTTSFNAAGTTIGISIGSKNAAIDKDLVIAFNSAASGTGAAWSAGGGTITITAGAGGASVGEISQMIKDIAGSGSNKNGFDLTDFEITVKNSSGGDVTGTVQVGAKTGQTIAGGVDSSTVTIDGKEVQVNWANVGANDPKKDSSMSDFASHIQSDINNSIDAYNDTVSSDNKIDKVSVSVKDGAFVIQSGSEKSTSSIKFDSSETAVLLGLGGQSSSTQGGGVDFQIGANQGQKMNVNIEDMRAAALGLDGVDLGSKEGAESAITTINDAINKVSNQRSELGAFQNRLEHTIKNLDNSAENLQAAESRIRDVDMAKEMMDLTKNNILQQAAQAMLAQANQAPQGVLQLLR